LNVPLNELENWPHTFYILGKVFGENYK